MTVNKIGFANFKSFGDKVQTFSDKPITLIYGANSVGKSSIMHSLLLMEYFKKTGSFDLEKSFFAGDALDLGGFENYVYKKNTNKEIIYEFTVTKPEEIGKYFLPIFEHLKTFLITTVAQLTLKGA